MEIQGHCSIPLNLETQYILAETKFKHYSPTQSVSLRLSINKDVLILQYNVTIFQCYFTVHNIDLNLLNQSAVLSHICEIVNLTLIRFVRWRVISRAITWHTDVTDIWRSSSCLTVWAQCGLPTWFSVRKSGQCENLSSGRENVTFHVTWVIDMG